MVRTLCAWLRFVVKVEGADEGDLWRAGVVMLDETRRRASSTNQDHRFRLRFSFGKLRTWPAIIAL